MVIGINIFWGIIDTRGEGIKLIKCDKFFGTFNNKYDSFESLLQ